MTYLILGANGLIGHQFHQWCHNHNVHHVGTCFSRETAGLIPFNQTDIANIPAFLDELQPTVVLNSIGLAGGVNFCEEQPRMGRIYHVEATCAMVDWCKKNKATFVFISTDYVFDGQNPPYRETDHTNPLNLYGQYKREAEEYIETNLDRYIIARTTNVFGWDPATRTPNFLMHLLQTLETRNAIHVPSFLYGNPTYVGDLVDGMMDLLQNEHFGLYHIVGSGYINRYDWAIRCLQMAGITGKTLIKQEQPPENMVPRPLLSHLDTTKFRNNSKVKLHDVDEGLAIFIRHMYAFHAY